MLQQVLVTWHLQSRGDAEGPVRLHYDSHSGRLLVGLWSGHVDIYQLSAWICSDTHLCWYRHTYYWHTVNTSAASVSVKQLITTNTRQCNRNNNIVTHHQIHTQTYSACSILYARLQLNFFWQQWDTNAALDDSVISPDFQAVFSPKLVIMEFLLLLTGDTLKVAHRQPDSTMTTPILCTLLSIAGKQSSVLKKHLSSYLSMLWPLKVHAVTAADDDDGRGGSCSSLVYSKPE